MTASKLTFLVCDYAFFIFFLIVDKNLAMYCLVFDLAYFKNFSRIKGLLNKSMWFSQLLVRKFS